MTPHGRGGTFMSRPCKRSVPSSPQVAVQDPPGPEDGHPRPVGHLASTLVRWDGLASGADLSGLPWHLGFAHAEIAVLVERIHSRSAAGSTAGRASTGGAVVPALVEPGARGRLNPGVLALRSHTAYAQAR